MPAGRALRFVKVDGGGNANMHADPPGGSPVSVSALKLHARDASDPLSRWVARVIRALFGPGDARASLEHIDSATLRPDRDGHAPARRCGALFGGAPRRHLAPMPVTLVK